MLVFSPYLRHCWQNLLHPTGCDVMRGVKEEPLPKQISWTSSINWGLLRRNEMERTPTSNSIMWGTESSREANSALAVYFTLCLGRCSRGIWVRSTVQVSHYRTEQNHPLRSATAVIQVQIASWSLSEQEFTSKPHCKNSSLVPRAKGFRNRLLQGNEKGNVI